MTATRQAGYVYLPKAFVEQRPEVLAEIVRRCGVAQLVTLTSDGLTASTVPLLLETTDHDGPNGRLVGHLARANPQWRSTVRDVDALAIFAGPDAYVSPSWYQSKADHGRVVPTWNYVVVHAHGPLIVHDDPAWTLALVGKLTEHHEAHRSRAWGVDDAPEAFIAAQLRGIVGIEIPLVRLVGQRKLSQNRSAGDIEGVLRGLDSGSDRESAVATEMRRS